MLSSKSATELYCVGDARWSRGSDGPVEFHWEMDEGWFDESGMVTYIGYESDAERQERIRLVEVERNQLHESLREHEYPVLEWETCTYRIRIDRTGDRAYRYASWKAEKSHSNKPDIVVSGGEFCCGGSEGDHTGGFVFQNGEYRYLLEPERFGYHLKVYRTDLTDPMEIMRSGELLLDEQVVDSGTGWSFGNRRAVQRYTRISACK